MPAILKSVQKTGRLLTSDDGSYSFSNCTEIVARVAEALPGTKIKRLAFPDAPAPGRPGDAQLHARGRSQNRNGSQEAG